MVLADVTNVRIDCGVPRDARLRFRSRALGADVAIGLNNLPDQITATFELTGLSTLLACCSTPQRMPRAKLERDLDDLARHFAFEFSPPLPVEMRAERIHR